MKIPRRKIADFLTERSLEPDVDRDRLSHEIAAYLLETNRAGELSSLARDIIQRRSERGIVEVTVISARPLSMELKKSIREKIRVFYPQAKKVNINETVDVNMIGGVRLELANEQLDLSVRSRLNRFKQLTSGKD